MKRYFGTRSAQALLAMWLVSLIVFGISELDPIEHRVLTFEEPIPPRGNLAIRYADFVTEMFLGYENGDPLRGSGSPVLRVLRGVPSTVYLVSMASVWGLVLSLSLGALGPRGQTAWTRPWVNGLSLLLLSVPIFWITLWLLVLVAHVGLPNSGIVRLLEAAFLLGLLIAAVLLPRARSIMGETSSAGPTPDVPIRWMNRARRLLGFLVTILRRPYSLTAAVLIFGLAIVEIGFALDGAARFLFSLTGFFVLSLMLIVGIWMLDIYRASREGRAPSGLPSSVEVTHTPPSSFPGARRRWIAAATLLVVLAVPAVIGPIVAPHDPNAASLSGRLLPPSIVTSSSDNVLGTDKVGRDVLSRVLHGYRMAFAIGFWSVAVAIGIGVVLWRLAALSPGAVAAAINRLVRAYGSFPTIAFVVLLIAASSGDMWAFYLVGSVFWPLYFHHAGNNGLTIAPLAALAACQYGFVILLSANLNAIGAFYGGLARPNPEWGTMILDGLEVLTSAWWVAFWPGLAVLLTVFGFFLIGQWLAEGSRPAEEEERPLLDGGLRPL